MAMMLWKHRDEIDRPEMLSTYGFLTIGYRAEYYYWEIIIMYRKSILVIATIFMGGDDFMKVDMALFFPLMTCLFECTHAQGLNVMMYLVFWYLIQMRCQPFLTHELNVIE